MYDRCMIKEEGQWYGKDISWQKSRAFNDHLMMLIKNGRNVGQCRQRKMSKVGGIRSYIPGGRFSFRPCGFRGRYLAGLSFAWPETCAFRKDSGLPQLTHEPTEWRKKFVMECYSSFGLNSRVLYGCNSCKIRNEFNINIVVVLRTVHLPPLRRIGKERASACRIPPYNAPPPRYLT